MNQFSIGLGKHLLDNMIKINYQEHSSFTKAFKKLFKRFPSLSDDLNMVKCAAVELYHIHNIDNHSVVEIPKLSQPHMRIFKVKKFACKALKGHGVQSGIRLVYAFNKNEKSVLFLDIYYKGDRENENRAYLRSLIRKL